MDLDVDFLVVIFLDVLLVLDVLVLEGLRVNIKFLKGFVTSDKEKLGEIALVDHVSGLSYFIEDV